MCSNRDNPNPLFAFGAWKKPMAVEGTRCKMAFISCLTSLSNNFKTLSLGGLIKRC